MYCVESDCLRQAESGSNYCSLHKPVATRSSELRASELADAASKIAGALIKGIFKK